MATGNKLAPSQRLWKESNPLRIFRLRYGIPQALAGAAIGTTKTTIQMWESGGTNPNSKHMQLLKSYIGDPFLDEKWENWYNNRPVVTESYYCPKGN